MRVLTALLISAILHAGMVWFWPYHAAPIPKPEYISSVLQVHLLNEYKKFPTAEPLPPVVSATAQKMTLVNKPLAITTAQHINAASKIKNQFADYLPTKELERKALPISNIDSSMFNDIFLSGMPVRLRLYINASGKITKIVRKYSLEQDEEMTSRLENLLYQMTFIPARKNSLDVDSYQDIEFNFHPVLADRPGLESGN